jgi:hypothetical protein
VGIGIVFDKYFSFGQRRKEEKKPHSRKFGKAFRNPQLNKFEIDAVRAGRIPNPMVLLNS